ncbi:UNVERIFIED_CONTAM: Sucrose-phosphatase 2 [Sesamum calycinum]|uniref:Sucrose-phosphatase 2 n=1 Tax=Sesamum calycinum TaxID=2727403 RepID=A0AAW2NUU1_9LAMI
MPPSLTLPSLRCHIPTSPFLLTPCSTTAVATSFSQSESSLRKTMDRLAGNANLMIVSDLDHTMVDHYDAENLSLLRFNALWESKYRSNSLLVFSTGRSPTLYKELRKEKPMLTPDITIMSVGTEITYGNSMVPDDGWVEFLNQKWDRNIVSEDAQVKRTYSSGAGKGQALAYLHKKFKAEGKLPKNALVCGDSGNDAELFSIPDVHGVMVSNAQEELLQWHAANAKANPKIIHATERCAAGIIQAIGHFKLGPSTSPRDVMDTSDAKMETFDPAYEVVKFYLFYERWRRAEVEQTEQYLANLKAVCCPSGIFIHPSGSEQLLRDCLSSLRTCYGDKQGKQFRVWVDQVLPQQVGSDSWLVKFKKWEQSGEERQCCLTTALLSSKDVTVTRRAHLGACPSDMVGWSRAKQSNILVILGCSTASSSSLSPPPASSASTSLSSQSSISPPEIMSQPHVYVQ